MILAVVASLVPVMYQNEAARNETGLGFAVAISMPGGGTVTSVVASAQTTPACIFV